MAKFDWAPKALHVICFATLFWIYMLKKTSHVSCCTDYNNTQYIYGVAFPSVLPNIITRGVPFREMYCYDIWYKLFKAWNELFIDCACVVEVLLLQQLAQVIWYGVYGSSVLSIYSKTLRKITLVLWKLLTLLYIHVSCCLRSLKVNIRKNAILYNSKKMYMYRPFCSDK